VARTVSVKLLADVAQFTAAVGGKAVGAVKDLGGELDKAAKAGKLDNTIRATAALGLGLTGMAAGAVKMSMDFEKSMSAVSAATHASAGDLGQLRAAAIQAGKDTQYSATGAADAITELSKAGVHTADILGGGLKGALDLAAAGQIDVGEAAQTAASAMTQFGLSGNQVPHIADLLAAAAGKAQGSVHDMGYALNQSGLVASQFGLSIEDTTGALAEFASAGLLGSDAGTSFKTMLLAMANPTDITKNKMDELGISFYDAQGKFIGVAGVAQVLQTRLKDLTEEQRNQALGQIFGNDAIRAASILYKDGAGGVQKWAKAVNDTGYASTTAAKLTDNLAGDLERLRGSLETVAIESGGGATGGLRKLTQGANAAVNAFADLPGWVQQSITVLSGVGGVSLLAAAGFLKARGTTKDLMDELREMGPRWHGAANGLSKVTSVAGKLGLVGGRGRPSTRASSSSGTGSTISRPRSPVTSTR
jgi:TP901 family phage tail tape measure protein